MPNFCSQCGTATPATAHAGQCPQCLLKVGLEESQADANITRTEVPEQSTPKQKAFEPPTISQVQERFPQFEIIELIGRGGMGAVYKVRQRELDRIVALKILPPTIAQDQAFAERFAREARALAKLNHQNIVQVYESGQQQEFFYILMEYVDGVNLRQAIQESQLASAEAMAIVPQICAALQFAHNEGVVHRDIKPENILLGQRGQVKIADFGLAKLLGHDAEDNNLTAAHQVLGTIRYMAPEQFKGSQHADHRSDIYSLGVVFYELLTGEIPAGRFELPSQLVEVDVRIDDVVLRSLAQDPSRRYQHARVFRTDIEGLSGQSAAQEQIPLSPADRAKAMAELQWPALALIVAGLLSCLCAALLAGLKLSGVDMPKSLLLELCSHPLPIVLSLIAGATAVYGGWKMLHAQSYALSRAGAVVLLTPFSPVFVIGSIAAAWALTVLKRPHVQQAFPDATPPLSDIESARKIAQDQMYVQIGAIVGAIAGAILGFQQDNLIIGLILGGAIGVAIGMSLCAAPHNRV